MFFRKNDFRVMFDFSFSIQRASSLYDAWHVSPERVAPDFADSYYYNDARKSKMDLASDYYSIAVILFKLLVGKLPYHGKVMEHEPDCGALEHSNWMGVYHKNTYFIFDPEDDTNHIGGETGFANDEAFVDRWNSLPGRTRGMFIDVFRASNVQRSAGNLVFYPPWEWREALQIGQHG